MTPGDGLKKSFYEAGQTDSCRHKEEVTMAAQGIYKWEYAGGSFPVDLRPQSVFSCPSFPVGGSTWSATPDGKIAVDFKKYGQYEFSTVGEGLWEGSVVGAPTNWRKLQYLRAHSAAEVAVLGEHGCGTAWSFQYEKGTRSCSSLVTVLYNIMRRGIIVTLSGCRLIFFQTSRAVIIRCI
jgi:hypothetical protein